MDVSVIIPTYNRIWCLPRAIESCRGTVCRTEIIVIDDGSTDETWAWLQQQHDVTSIRQRNQGQTWAINRGVQAASGRYIRFLDSDDFLCSGAIDRQFAHARETGVDLIYSRVDQWEQTSARAIENPELPDWDDFLAVQLGESNGGHFLGMLFRRELVEKVPRRPDFALREDRMFLLEIGLLFPTISRVMGLSGYWVHHRDQMQGGYRGMKAVAANWQMLTMYKRILSELDERGELTARRKEAASKVLWQLAHHIGYSNLPEAIEVAAWVHELAPTFAPPERGILGSLYRQIGFRRTEQLLSVRRKLRKILAL